ncbi:MAG: hypothetical protein NDI73_00015 [Desulfuromonadales bacterium]|nr:hypothetical protein [Desulfuromonadales bacterium]
MMRYFFFILLLFIPVQSLAAYCQYKPACNYSSPQGTVCSVPSYMGSTPQGFSRTVTIGTQMSNGESCDGLAGGTDHVDILSNRVYLHGPSGHTCAAGKTPYMLRGTLWSDYTGSCVPPTCESFTYSDWSTCSNGTQTRTVISSLPSGCTGGTPILSQACTPLEPPNCSDGTKSGDETGIDCGGGCSSPCESFCPDGSNQWGVEADGRSDCAVTALPDDLGNCPANWDKTTVTACPPTGCPDGRTVGQTVCAKAVLPVDSKSSDLVPPYTGTGGWVQFHGETSSTSTTTPGTSTTVNNPDGTTTTTSSTSSTSSTSGTGGSGSVTSTTTTTIIKDSQGNTISETTEKDQTEDGGRVNPSNYDWSSPTFDGTGADQQASRFATRFQQFKSRLEGAPVYVPLKGIFSPSMSNRSAVYTINAGSYGLFDVNLADYGNAWSIMKYALIFLAMFIAARIIIVNK